ncbi:hypothetical protein FACS1894109_15780 [Spirochaetia bacterium]|nr:hypothetical protein FACS1894109_15780 [Spirochaetia bacterium]
MLAPARGITAAYATNVLKTLGIHEGNYRIINAGVLSRIYHERVYAALMVLCCVLLICRFPRVLSKMNICIGIMGAAIVLILLRQILTICLGWRDAVSFGGLIQNEFLLKTAPLRNYYQWDAVLFAVFLFLAVSIIIRRFYLWVRR